MPYIFLQPRLYNSYEWKAGCLSNDITAYGRDCQSDFFMVLCHQQGKHATQTTTDEDVLAFAARAHVMYKAYFGTAAATSPTFRVDMFRTTNLVVGGIPQAPKLVVNEFESLEAQFIPMNDPTGLKLATSKTFMYTFWCDVFRQCMDKHDELGLPRKLSLL